MRSRSAVQMVTVLLDPSIWVLAAKNMQVMADVAGAQGKGRLPGEVREKSDMGP